MAGRADDLAAPAPFRDFVAQARFGVSQAEHEAFFARMLADVTEPTAPFGLLDVQGDGSGVAEARLDVDLALARRARAAARALGVSVASLWHLAFALVLSRLSGRDDVVFGTVLFGRMHGGAHVDRAIGMFLNTLPMRIRPGEESVRDSLRRVHAGLTELFRHEHASLTLAQRCSGIEAPTPLFSALLNYRHTASEEGTSVPRRARSGRRYRTLLGRANQLSFRRVGGRLRRRFRIGGADAKCGRSQCSLHLSSQRIGGIGGGARGRAQTSCRAIDILSNEELSHLTSAVARGADHDYGNPLDLVDRFESQALRMPDAVAACCEGAASSYGELNRRANRLAHVLAGEGVGPDVIVALLDARGLDFLTMMLAIFKAGGAYLPLDPAHPDGRIAQVLEESKSKFLLVGHDMLARGETIVSALSGAAPEPLRLLDLEALGKKNGAARNPPRRHGPHNLAFIIYTSGSTGKPKGAMVEHCGMFNNLITKVPALD